MKARDGGFPPQSRLSVDNGEVTDLWFFQFWQIIFFGFLNNLSLSLSLSFATSLASQFLAKSSKKMFELKCFFVIVPADFVIVFDSRENVSNNKVVLHSEFVSW